MTFKSSTRTVVLFTALALVLSFGFSAESFSQQSGDSGKSATATPATNISAPAGKQGHTLGMVTGSATGTYYRFGYDIKNAVAKNNLVVDVKESSGSIENIDRITSNENVSLGIVQSDVLGFLMRSNEPKSKEIAKSLRMVFPFYQEEVHVIANKSVRKFSDLNGKTVVVGESGSGSWLTAMNMFNLTGVRPVKLLRIDQQKGMVEVLRGRADALIYVSGKPVKLFQNLESLISNENDNNNIEEVHLVPIDEKELLAEYAPAKIIPGDYKFVNSEVPTIAVTAVLVTYNFSRMDNEYVKTRCDDIRTFSKSILDSMDMLRKNGHPKWSEVDLAADIGVWKRDECSSSAAPTRTIENELLNTMEMKW